MLNRRKNGEWRWKQDLWMFFFRKIKQDLWMIFLDYILFLLAANINSRRFMDINCSSLSDPCDDCSRSRQNPGSRAGRQKSADSWIFINRLCEYLGIYSGYTGITVVN